MQIAIEEARAAAARGEVPIGAALVGPDGTVIARDGNRTLERRDPTAHAEILVIREACRILGAQRIPDHDLYVTLEPCTMCAGAISFARIRTLIAGATDPKGGGVWHGARFFTQTTCHHRPAALEQPNKECGQILKCFFKNKREQIKPPA